MHILVTPTGKTDDNTLLLRHSRRQLEDIGNRMGRLQRRDNPFFEGQRLKPSSASSSVIETYSARPESFSQACSGPTPG